MRALSFSSFSQDEGEIIKYMVSVEKTGFKKEFDWGCSGTCGRSGEVYWFFWFKHRGLAVLYELTGTRMLECSGAAGWAEGWAESMGWVQRGQRWMGLGEQFISQVPSDQPASWRQGQPLSGCRSHRWATRAGNGVSQNHTHGHEGRREERKDVCRERSQSHLGEVDGVSELTNSQGALCRLSRFCPFQAGLRIWLHFLW